MKTLLGSLLICLVTVVGSSAVGSEALSPSAALKESGVKGGLVVHLGCGDGRSTVSLRLNDSYIVHGLDTDADNISAARERTAEANLAGKITFDVLRSASLPYIDNLVNLIVAEDLGDISTEEAMRVLRPGGVLQLRDGDKWAATVKPRPMEIDEWTHFLHDASGNPVADDTLVGPPRHMQWLASPLWSRNHHKLASISSAVTAGGRLFYIMDSGTAANMSVEGKWSLVARDAFNGVLLWQKPMDSWAYQGHGFRSGPVQLPRTLVAGPKRVYAPLGMSAAVSAMDPATGEIVRTYKETAGAEELILIDGALLVVVGEPVAEQAGIDPARRTGFKFPNTKTIVAVEVDTGKVLWKWSDADSSSSNGDSSAGRLVPLTLAADDGRVFFEAGSDVVCLDLADGRQVWSTSPPHAEDADAEDRKTKASKPKSAKGKNRNKNANKKKRTRYGADRRVGWSLAALAVSDGVVLLADGDRLRAFSCEDGEPLWNNTARRGLCRSPSEMFVIDGLVWQGPFFTEGRDVHTGEVKRTNTATDDTWTSGHHHRCYRNKATPRYIMTAYRGIELLDLSGSDHSRNNWIRGTCQYGIMPANGLIYAPAHACGCFMEAKLRGFWAVAPRREQTPPAAGPPLVKGPAYGKVAAAKTEPANSQPDWPTYRRDALRSGSTTAKLPASLKNVWRVEIGGRLSAPVVAEGLAIVASMDSHRIVAVDADDGARRWSYTAGGRVDSPPTVCGGLVLFGCADGWVYCLSATDGSEVWRYRVAPDDRRTIARDQIESVWPVHGSVLVQDGLAYAAAGRVSYLDGGVRIVALDIATGRKVHESIIRTDHPKTRDREKAAAETNIEKKTFAQNATDYKTFTDPDLADAFSMAGTTNDVLVGDGTAIYLRTRKFDRKCMPQAEYGRHLFSTSGLLDGAENHRSHWALGTGDFSRTPVAYSWIANRSGGAYGSRLSVPYGVMLSYDGQSVWGVKRPGYKGDRYQLFAQANSPFSPTEKHLPDFRRADNKTTMPEKWSVELPLRPRAMLRASDVLVLAGMAERPVAGDPHATFEGRAGGLLQTASATDGEMIARRKLKSPPVWDGLAAAGGRLYLSAMDGTLTCIGGE